MAFNPIPEVKSKKYPGGPISGGQILSEIFGSSKYKENFLKPLNPKIKTDGAREDYSVFEAYEGRDIEEIIEAPGVEVLFPLEKAITKPAEFVKEMATQSVKQVFTVKDQEKESLKRAWGDVVSGNSGGSRGEIGAEFLERVARGPEETNLNLNNVGLKRSKIKTFYVGQADGKFKQVKESVEEDIYSDLIDPFKSAIVNMGNKGSRNDTMRGWQTKNLAVLSQDIEDAIAAGKIAATSDEARLILAQTQIANSMGALSNSMKEISGAASKTRLFTNPVTPEEVKWDPKKIEAVTKDIRNGKVTLAEAIQQGLISDKTREGQIYLKQLHFLETVDKSRQEIDALLAANKGTLAGKALEKQVRQHRAYLEKLHNKFGNVRAEELTRGGMITYGGNLKFYIHELENPNFMGGIRDRFLNGSYENIASPGSNMRALLRNTKGGATLTRLGLIMKEEYRKNTIDDLADTIAKGADEMLGDYVMSRWVNRVAIFGPPKLLEDVLVKTHYFGLNYEADGDPNLAKWVPINKFKLDVLGKSVQVVGGAHFEGSIELYKLLASGQLKGSVIKTPLNNFNPIANFNDITSASDLIALLNGHGVPGLKIQNLANFEKHTGSFKKWLLENAEALGIQLDGNTIVTSVENSNRILAIINQTTNKNSNKALIDATLERVGILKKYTSLLAQSQQKYYDILNGLGIGKYIRGYYRVKEAVAQALANALYGMFVGATGGTGTLAMPLKWLLEIAARRIVDAGSKLFSALNPFSKVTFKEVFTGITKTIDGAIDMVVKFFVYPMLGLMLIVVIVVSSILGLVNQSDPARATTFKELDAGGGYPIPPNVADCINDPDNGYLETLPGVGGKADEAKDIAQGLLRGFWCFWNHHPNYDPEFWNQTVFEQNPSPGSDFGCGSCLFWCTVLPIKAYDGQIPENLLGAQEMADYFGYVDDQVTSTSGDGQRIFIANTPEGIAAHGLQSGDVMFFRTPKRKYYRIAHVAVLHSVEPGAAAESVHSNSYWKGFSYTLNSDGTLQDYKIGGETIQEVIGFGRFL